MPISATGSVSSAGSPSEDPSATSTPAAENATMPTASRGSSPAGRMAVLSALSATPPSTSTAGLPTTIGETAARVALVPRIANERVDQEFAHIAQALQGRVTDGETRMILNTLEWMEPGECFAILDKLQSAPWKGDKSLFEKLVRRGIDDDNDFIAEFARVVSKHLGVTMPTAEDRAGGRDASACAVRNANRELRADSKAVLDYFDCPDKQSFLASLGQVARAPFQVVGALVGILILAASPNKI